MNRAVSIPTPFNQTEGSDQGSLHGPLRLPGRNASTSDGVARRARHQLIKSNDPDTTNVVLYSVLDAIVLEARVPR